MNSTRKYLPTISELIDRLSIVQLKEVFIPEHKEKYSKEIQDIVHDLDKLGLQKEYDYSTLGKLIPFLFNLRISKSIHEPSSHTAVES